MGKGIKRFFIGRPLKNEALGEEKFGILWGLPILASDAISSVAYASEEILLVLVPAIGYLAYRQLSFISAAIIGLLIILTISYRQTIQNYPNGGGAYIVAKENLGVLAGVTAGAALSIDYILTVAVSISAGTDALTSAFRFLRPFTVPLCLGILILIMIGNLRGIRESSKAFSIPTYAFIFAILAMIAAGVIKYKSGAQIPEPLPDTMKAIEPVTLILLLKAFANGCAAVTGVEAVSNAVPNFKKPSTKHANTVMILLSLLVLTLFGGVSLLANMYHVVPTEGKTVLSQIAVEIFGIGPMFYFIQITTMIILALAANTAFSGFPLLISVMSQEGYVPRQLSMRGDRLSYSNGIIALTSLSALLIVVFNAKVTSLIGLYAIGVFISFTLSQTGMFTRWIRTREKGWVLKAIVNGFGALVTAVVVLIIAIFKFREGAWIVVIVVPILILMMLRVKKHYIAIYKQLRVSPEEMSSIDVTKNTYRNRVVVPVESVNKASIRALRYARTISDNVVAFNVSIDEAHGKKIRERYSMLNTDIPLIIKYSPFRKVVEPLLKFIESTEYDYQRGDMITVILPQFSVKAWWQNLLHNHSRIFIERELLKHKHIVVSTMPLQMKDDNYVLKSPKYNK